MNPSDLSTQFSTTAQHLDQKGHLILVRRARSYLEEGRADLAAAFLAEATRRMPMSPIRALSDALQTWRREDGDLDALLIDEDWRTATTQENELSATIARKTQDQGYAALLRQLRGEPPPAPPVTVHVSNDVMVAQWTEDEPTSEVFEAPSRIYERPTEVYLAVSEQPPLSSELIAGVIVMLQALTVYFCFFRPF